MKRLLGLTTAFLLLAPAQFLFAQMPGGAGSTANTALLKLFGKHNNFTVHADMQMLDGAQKETMNMDFTMSVLDGKLRADVDVSKIKGALMPPEAIAQMKQMGMDRVTSIVRPDKKMMILIYPGLNAYMDVPLPKGAADSLNSEPKIEKTALGKETINGHSCVKSKVLMTDANGQKQEITVWDATDLKNFPIKVQMIEEGQNIVMQYKDVQFIKPDPKQFEPPQVLPDMTACRR